MRIVAEPRAVDVRSSHQFEEEIGAASSENGLFIAKMEFSAPTGRPRREDSDADIREDLIVEFYAR
jgi:ribosomal protein S4